MWSVDGFATTPRIRRTLREQASEGHGFGSRRDYSRNGLAACTNPWSSERRPVEASQLQPKASSNLLLSTIHGRSDWYSCSRTARIVGSKTPATARPHEGATRSRGGAELGEGELHESPHAHGLGVRNVPHTAEGLAPLAQRYQGLPEVLDVGDA